MQIDEPRSENEPRQVDLTHPVQVARAARNDGGDRSSVYGHVAHRVQGRLRVDRARTTQHQGVLAHGIGSVNASMTATWVSTVRRRFSASVR